MTIRRAYFRDGDLSEFDATSVDGGDLSVAAGVGKFGVYGLQGVIDDTNSMYARFTETFTGEMWMGCYVKLSDPFTGINTKSFTVLRFYGTGWACSIYVRYDTATGWRWLLVKPSSGSHTTSTLQGFNIGQWYWVEYHIKRSSGAGATDGEYHVWIDGVLAYDNNAIDNNPPASTDMTGGQINLTSIDAGFVGTVYYDNFGLSNEGRICPTRSREAAQVNRALGIGIGRQIA